MFGSDAMTAADSRRRSRRRSRMVRLTLAIAGAAWLAAPTAARASAAGYQDYVLSNVTANFNGTPESISGVFAVLGQDEEAFVQFQVTGPRGSVINYFC